MIYEPSDYTASFSSLAARNATFLLALILIASPVAGFRPSSWPLPDLQDAKTSNSNTFSLLEMLGDETDKIVEQGLSLPFRQLMLLGQAGRKMLESDWTIGRFRLSCHDFEPFIERE